MNSMDLKRAEKLSFNLLIASVALAVLIFLVVSLTGDGWAQIAGFYGILRWRLFGCSSCTIFWLYSNKNECEFS